MSAKNIVSFLSGLIFAVGLALAGMTRPENVMSFLDWSQSWNPSLLFVMGGAVTLNLIAYRWIMKKGKPVFDTAFHLPQRLHITKALIIGSVLFGIGWGLSGFCPGPAFVSVFALNTKALVFVISMLIGMKVFQLLRRNNHFEL